MNLLACPRVKMLKQCENERDLFCCKYDGQFEGHTLAHKFQKGDTFLHVAARYETAASGAFLSWLLQHAPLALEMKNCLGEEPAQCASNGAVRDVIHRKNAVFRFPTRLSTNKPAACDAPSSISSRLSHSLYDVFISYRNDTEVNFATALQCILSARPFNMKVFWDKYSLPIGGGHLDADNPLDHQDLAWMTDLYKAMYNSKIILILVSHEGIVAPFAHLSSGTDACLAEHLSLG